MKNKLWFCAGVAVVGTTALSIFILFLMVRGPRVEPAASLLARDTIYYCGSRSPLKIRTALAVIDLPEMLQESAGLTGEESRIVSEWFSGLQGVQVGFSSFTLFPFVLDAAVVLEGTFDRPLPDILSPGLQEGFQQEEPYRSIAVQKIVLPLHSMVSLEIYVTDPVQDRVLIAFSRRSLTGVIDRMLDGGASLADHPEFRVMSATKEMRGADLVQYVDVQAYLRMLYDWTKSIPQPQVKGVADLLWSELRLSDYGSSISAWRFDRKMSQSLLRIDPANPLCRQLRSAIPLQLPSVPGQTCQFSFCRLAEPADAVSRLMEMTVRMTRGITEIAGAPAMRHVNEFLGQFSQACGGDFTEFGPLLTGEFGVWQRSASKPADPAFCAFIGIRDSSQINERIAAFGQKVNETDGICALAGSDALYWSVQPSGLLIATDLDYLKATLASKESSLTATPEFQELLNELPSGFSAVEYVSYDQGVPGAGTVDGVPALGSCLDLLNGFRKMTVIRAEERGLKSQSVQRFRPDTQAVRAVVKALFSAEYPEPRLGNTALPEISDDAIVQNRIADAYYYGRGVPLDDEKAVMWYRKSAEQGNAEAQNSLGICFAKGRGVSADDVEAVRWYRLAAEQGDMTGQYNLGARYGSGRGVVQDDVESVKWLSKSAEQGHSWAENDLGLRYERGDGLPENPVLAAAMYRKAARQGYVCGQYNLGRCYADGCGVPPDDAEAVKWYRKAAGQEYSAAMYQLGLCYLNGKGVSQNDAEALDWFHKAAELNNTNALIRLGFLFQKGIVVEKDLTQAMTWFQLAADQGSASGWESLGQCYGGDDQHTPDYEQELFCYKKSLEIDPENARALNSYAWFLVTCKDQSFRDFPAAVRLAEQSVELEADQFNLDTLAVAYDRNGQFDQAVETQKQLIAFRQKNNPDTPVPKRMTARLARFESQAAGRGL